MKINYISSRLMYKTLLRALSISSQSTKSAYLSQNRFMKKIFLTAFCCPLLLLAQPFTGKIGVNLEGISGISLPFVNATLTASAWQSVATSGNAMTDSLGWPIEDFRAL